MFLIASSSVEISITMIRMIVIIAADNDKKFVLGYLVLQSLFLGVACIRDSFERFTNHNTLIQICGLIAVGDDEDQHK